MVLSAGQERRAVSPDRDHLAFHRLKHAVGQHERGTVQGWPAVELQQGLTRLEDLSTEGQHLTAEHVVLPGCCTDLSRHGGCCAGLGADHLQRHALVHAVWVGTAKQHGDTPVAVRNQVDRAHHARVDGAIRAGRDVHRRDVAGPRTPRLLRLGPGQQVGEPELAVLEAGDTDDLVLTAGVRQPRVQAGLHVHVLVWPP
jgi:hypothetical protein